MPKFIVTLMEVAYYDIIVEAENEEDAAVAAEAAFVNADNISDYLTGCEDREAYNIERMSDEMAAELVAVDPTNRYPMSDWQYEVANNYTKLGYVEWVEHQIEAEGGAA